MGRYGLGDDQWGRIEDLLPGGRGSLGVAAADNRVRRRRPSRTWAITRAGGTNV